MRLKRAERKLRQVVGRDRLELTQDLRLGLSLCRPSGAGGWLRGHLLRFSVGPQFGVGVEWE